MRTPLVGVEPLQRQRVLVEERPAPLADAHVDDVAEAEAEQDALLHPDVDAPAGRRRRHRAPPRAPARATARRGGARNASRASSRGALLPCSKSDVICVERLVIGLWQASAVPHQTRAAAPSSFSCCSTRITFSRAAALGGTSGRR